MQTEMDKAPHQPILEPWRIAALVLIIVVAMLLVHAVDPAGAGIIEQTPSPQQAQIAPLQPTRP
ncbi:hypothetical protein [Methylobacterium trifolii]|uniref:Energy transducer TonB n=1 Tax=Methylobacterium trifolii TaxID=1003092 RepID=A0ABQ4TUU9_9HYPH|nr:hypothetical protein [Methylobacterium trifolii]GJE58841.1 hypothetical protein MPOCJGCO_0926 [Methylobacterium trifolii]